MVAVTADRSVRGRDAPLVGGVTTALLYTRISGAEKQLEGLSLDAQLAECRRYVARQVQAYSPSLTVTT